VTLQVTPEQAEKLVLAANEGKLQLVMRNYSDQEDSRTTGANKASLLTGESVKPEPAPASEKTAETKPAVTKPAIKRPKVVASISEKTLTVAAPVVSRNSVELIEGSKRRDVDVPY
jgi:pilus assembly protein CpaB